jgi:hypothetical protein
MALAMMSPMLESELAEMAPTWAISLLVVQGLEMPFSSPVRADHGLVDAALQVHRVHAGGNELHAFVDDRLGQHGGGGGAVAGDIGGLGSDFLDHLRAHVLELVLQFDFLGHGNAVLGDRRGAERAVQNHIAALGAQGDLDRIGQDVDAGHHAVTGGIAEAYVFSCHCLKLLICFVVPAGGNPVF